MKHTDCFFFFVCLSASLLLSSCEIYNPAEPIPAYIHIDKINLTTAVDGTQGTSSHKITDAWVYIDEKLIGCFELPASFPVLYEGSHEVKIRAGIKVNGMSGVRKPYPFYDYYIQTVDLQKFKTVTLSPTVKYKTTTTFALLENFENVGMLIDTTSKSFTPIQKISAPAENVFEGSNSAVAYLDASTLTFFECASVNKYALPQSGADVFLEFNYKSNYHFTVSVIAYGSNTSDQFSVLNYNPSAEWNKAYVHLTPAVSGAYNAINYKIALGTTNSTGADSIAILLDNIKLVH